MKFNGLLEAEVKIHVTLTAEGWAAVGRTAVAAGRAITGVARGLAYSGQVAAVTTGVAVAVGVGVGVIGFTWVGFTAAE